MSEQLPLSQSEAALMERLASVGIPINKTLWSTRPLPDQQKSGWPVCSVWPTSEMPTDEEMVTLTEVAEAEIAFYRPHVIDESRIKGYYSPGANTITFIKKDSGLWQYRRWSWDPNEWSNTPKPLQELKQDVLR